MLQEQIVAAYVRLLDYPRSLLAVMAGLLTVAVFYGSGFSFDASSDTLVVEGDPDLATYLEVSATFGGDDFLLLTFTPHEGDIFDPDNLATLDMLAARLAAVPGVRDVFSILDAPLLKSPPVPLTELAAGFRTLRSADVDLDLAAAELTASPLFRELLITTDGRSSALRISLDQDRRLAALEAEQEALQAGRVHPAGGRLAEVEQQRREARARYLEERDRLIASVRGIRDEFTDRGVLHLGGVPMIAADMIAFVKNDLFTFGGLVFVLLVGSLYGFFRNWRWVLLPVAGSMITIAYTVGILGFAGRPVTVISSNFISLLAIITISLNIHLIVRYRELLQRDAEEGDDPDAAPGGLAVETMRSKFAPCVYNTLTTMAAFGSLMASSIVPVEDFGWMMCLGIFIGFLVTFAFFPAALLLIPGRPPGAKLNEELAFTRVLSFNARWRPGAILFAALGLLAVGVLGLSQVTLDNRFIDYFDENTEINAGMRFIDDRLGGTVPFEVVVAFDPYDEDALTDGEMDDFDDFDSGEEDAYPQRYWYTRDKLDRVAGLQTFLQTRPEVGKVLSLATLESLALEFTGGEPLSAFEIAAVLGELPDELRAELIEPYADPASGRMRLSARVVESGPAFDRAKLVADIRAHAEQVLGLAAEQIQITGMMVLFNSMLTQLFDSQVNTLIYVVGATFLMFLILLRSPLYALLGLVPNLLAAATVLAFMGYAQIPLDMMTITIAAVSVGIGVDDAIHYLHRFKEEFARTGDAREAVAWSHATIGRAMYFTSLTIVIGFSVLAFSNFVPTVTFGLLVALAMVLALLANLTLLPALLVLCLAGPRPLHVHQAREQARPTPDP
ncbi:MAG: RND family transporter [Pseudomonadales bacterium]|nr:RND family transporter [Pseudomonadales bacterium]